MKEILLVFAVLIALLVDAPQASAQLIVHTNGNDKQAIIFPEVVFSANDNELIVAFDATESYTLQVKDASGVTQYSTPIVTDGNEYSCPVNLAPHAYYVVTIYSTNNTFSGVLFTP